MFKIASLSIENELKYNDKMGVLEDPHTVFIYLPEHWKIDEVQQFGDVQTCSRI